MVEAEITQGVAPVGRTLGGYTEHLRHILRDQSIVSQCRLQANIGAW